MIRALALAAAPMLLLLPGCGLQPLYGGGSGGMVAQTLESVSVAPIPGRAGWLLGGALRERLHFDEDLSPRYRLDVRIDQEITGLGIRADDSVTRERRILRARYQLVDLGSGLTVVDSTAGSDAGIDVVESEYATIAAEEAALERLAGIVADEIVARLARFARSGEAPQ